MTSRTLVRGILLGTSLLAAFLLVFGFGLILLDNWGMLP